jgi:hypothetical protein
VEWEFVLSGEEGTLPNATRKLAVKISLPKRDIVRRERVQNLLHYLIHFSWGGKASSYFLGYLTH